MADISRTAVFDARKTLVGDDAVGMLAKLLWEMKSAHDNPVPDGLTRGFMSYNMAATAWHIHEWLWRLHDENDRDRLYALVKAPTKDLAGFGRGCQRSNWAVGVCRQLATAGKHYSVEYHREDIYTTIYDGDAVTPARVVIHCDGKQGDDLVTYAAALVWWCNMYVDLGYKHAESLRDAVAKM